MSLGAFEIDEPWTLAEETMLLDAVEQYGFGNWEDVANHVESKSADDCETHYNSFFIWGNIGKATFPTEPFGKVIDHGCPEGGPLSPSITVPVNALELTIQEQHELGYMPFRDDFEREHDNEAETLVSSLMVAYDDDDLDIAIKLTQIEKYRMRLKERDRRKQLARRYGLITAAAQSAAAATAAASTPGPKPSKSPYTKKRGSKEDREFQEKMKPFAQCHSCGEHETFLENHQKERELKNRIKVLLRYRRNGLTKLEDTEKFEDERFKRDKRKEYRLKKQLGSSSLVKRNSMASKKAVVEEKLGLLIDESVPKDEEEIVDTKELATFPGYELLSYRERKLCKSIGMTPATYITLKTCIVEDYIQRRQGYPVKIRFPNGIDKTHRRQILSFLAENGWIGLT